MTSTLRYRLACIVVGASFLPTAAMAQFDGKTCTPVPTATTAVPAPGSGSITVEPLTKFGLPALTCATAAFTGNGLSFDYTATLATRYNDAKFPSTCAGVEYVLNGGPTYTAVTGQGTFALNFANPTAITGTLNATAFSMTENLTLTVAGSSFVINTPLLSFKSNVTINADQSVDVRICTPAGGIPATVNGSSFALPTSIWQCLAEPTPAQANVRVTYVEGC